MTQRDTWVAAVLVIVVAARGIVGSNYEPTDETFRKRLGPFISQSSRR